MYCIDASVIINSQLKREPHHNQSKAFLIMVEEKNLRVFLPEIIIPE
jgi:predicted nucleic acid-binding protein